MKKPTVSPPPANDPELARLVDNACNALQNLIDAYNRPIPKPKRTRKGDQPIVAVVSGQILVATP